jgi:hypothetical protein
MSGNTREGAELGGPPGTGSGIGTGIVLHSTQPCTVLRFFLRCTDGHSIPPQTAPNQISQGESSFCDGSALLFYMYLKMADEEDKKMTERWEADADGILIFVSAKSFRISVFITPIFRDWSVLCSCGCVDRSICPGPQA